MSSLGARRAAGNDLRRSVRTRVPMTRSEARRGSLLPGRLGIEEEWAGGGPGPTGWRTGAGGPDADPGRRRLSGVLAEHTD